MKKFSSFLAERDVTLTLQIHQTLNPDLWNGELLRPDLRHQMIDWARHFVLFAGIAPNSVKDLIFTGSMANKNYTKFSDIDIHIITDQQQMTDDQLYQKKIQWEAAHRKLKLAGYPLEFYAQDAKEKLPSDQGQFSLTQNKWLVRPGHIFSNEQILNDHSFKKHVGYYIHRIRTYIGNKDVDKLREIKDRLHQQRVSGLAGLGEFSYGNALYKELRNRGWVRRITATLPHNN